MAGRLLPAAPINPGKLRLRSGPWPEEQVAGRQCPVEARGIFRLDQLARHLDLELYLASDLVVESERPVPVRHQKRLDH